MLCYRMEIEMQISVVIPAHNRKKYILNCVNSIINQTYPPIEIIVVDDYSTDGTADELKKLDCKILKVISLEKNGGAQVARNVGIKAATGDWIAFCDSDDWWLKDKLEKQVRKLESSGRKVSSTGAEVLQNGNSSERWTDGKEGMILSELIQNKTYLLFQGMLIKKECLYEIGLLDERVKAYQEFDTAIRLALRYEVDYINEPLFVYNIHNEETISKDTQKAKESKRYIFKKYKDIIEERLGRQGLSHWYCMLSSSYDLNDLKHWKYRIIGIIYKFSGSIYKTRKTR